MYNEDPVDQPDAPSEYPTCLFCSAVHSGNLYCAACREVMRQRGGSSELLDLLDDLQARKQGVFAEDAECFT